MTREQEVLLRGAKLKFMEANTKDARQDEQLERQAAFEIGFMMGLSCKEGDPIEQAFWEEQRQKNKK